MSFADWNWDELFDAPRLPEVMRFTMYYDGFLPSGAETGRIKEKHDIREKLHWQILQLFRDHPALPKPVRGIPLQRQDWANWSEWEWPSLVIDGQVGRRQQWDEEKAVITIGGLHFVPLIRESLDLICELDILFLRPGIPGLMDRSGARYDIDNRLLTLFDALTVPVGDKARDYAVANTSLTRMSPIFCLLGDDMRITSINVRTDSLLVPADNAKTHDVRLVIGVTVRGTRATWANHGIAE